MTKYRVVRWPNYPYSDVYTVEVKKWYGWVEYSSDCRQGSPNEAIAAFRESRRPTEVMAVWDD